MWHPEPKNDAWREAHLAHVESLGNRLWLSVSDRLRQKHSKRVKAARKPQGVRAG